MRRAPLGALLCFLLVCGSLLPAAAHPMDEWFTEMHWTTGQGLKARFRVPKDQRAKLDAAPLRFAVDGRALTIVVKDGGTDENGRVLVDVSAPFAESARALTIEVPEGLLDDNQSVVGFLTFDKAEPKTVMVPAGESRTVSAPTDAGGPSASGGSSASGEGRPDLGMFFKFGLKHILEGFDHLLFLFCLLIAGGTLRHLVVVVTAFTLGHSITLALSVLGFVSLPSMLTESLIAFSIIVAAISNLGRADLSSGATAAETGRRKALSRGAMAGGFGLIHGLGFAAMLLENGLTGSGVVVPLVGFNLGVEAGQLGLVMLSYPFLMMIDRSKYRREIVMTCSILAAGMGFFWLLERLGVISLG